MDAKRIGPVVSERRGPFSPLVSTLVRLGTIAAALVAGALVLVSAGVSVGEGYRAMWEGSLGSTRAIAQSLATATPLILTGLSVALARRMGLWNLGGEGQLYMGATFATAVALWFPAWPRLVLVPAMLAAGAIGGAAWALGPALLRAGLKVNEIITTFLLNVVAIVLVSYVVSGPWRDPLALGFPLSRELPGNALMPALFGSAVHAGFLLAIAAAFLLWLVFSLLRWPNMTGATGDGPGTGDVPVAARRNIVLAMVAAGALAGTAGMGEVSGVAYRLGTDVSANYGYVGILVAILGRFSPPWIAVLAVPFGALLVGGFALRNLGVSGWVVATLQAVVVAIVLSSELLARFRLRWARSQPTGRGG